MTHDQRLWLDENVQDHQLKYEETKRGWRWRIEAYGKYFYFSKINYPDADVAKMAALEFRDSLPSRAFSWSGDASLRFAGAA